MVDKREVDIGKWKKISVQKRISRDIEILGMHEQFSIHNVPAQISRRQINFLKDKER